MTIVMKKLMTTEDYEPETWRSGQSSAVTGHECTRLQSEDPDEHSAHVHASLCAPLLHTV